MARINKNGTLSGLMGNTVLRSYGDKTFASVKPDHVSNPQTREQMALRTKKQNIVNLYGAMKPALKDNFQDKVGKQSDYTKFVSCNLHQMPIHLMENEAAYKASVVAPYVVSFGNLTPVEYTLKDGWLISDIQVGDMQIDDDTRVYDLSASIISHNETWRVGDTLELIACEQVTKTVSASLQLPMTKCRYANIVLDNGDDMRLSKLIDNIEIKVNEDGFLCLKAAEVGGYAIVRKRPSSRGIITGIQQMAVQNPLLDHYTSDEQREAARLSYLTKENRRKEGVKKV